MEERSGTESKKPTGVSTAASRKKKLRRTPNQITKRMKKYIITHRSVMGALASCAVQQSPYPRPENLEIVLDKFHELIKDDLDQTLKKYIKKFDSWKECHEYIASRLHTIPEFEAWNERKNKRQGHGFTGAGHDDKGNVVAISKAPNPDDDFIDLDALTRNVTNAADKESKDTSELTKVH